MIGINIDVPQSDIDSMSSTFARYAAYYKGNIPKAVEKTMVQIIKALSGSTKVSSKLRPIVRNPDPRHKVDARMAMLGVYKYSNKKSPRKYFSPIKGTGEFGAAIRYVGKDKVLMRVRGAWEVFSRAEMESMNYGSRTIQNHKKRIIGRSGLAKSSWSWMLGKLGASAAALQSEIGGTTTVTRINTDGAFNYFGILGENKLKYIRNALHGRQDISTAIRRAELMMMYDMKEITRKAKANSGLRAA
jgi:hypothetical protein